MVPSLALALLLLVIGVTQHLVMSYFESQIANEMKGRADELADGLINGMNMLMVTGQVSNPDNRTLLLRKMSSSRGVDELRIIRAQQVTDQFGPGLKTEEAQDEIDHRAIKERKPIYSYLLLPDGRRQFRAVIPFIASSDFRGTNCLSCHHVEPGSVNGAASILLNMEEQDAKLALAKHWVWIGDLVLILMMGLILVWRRMDRRIRTLANFDEVTGLPNRHLLHDRLSQAISYARRYNLMVSLLFIDMDDFKAINDSLGHEAGDVLLREFGHRLSLCVRESDTVARIGGDEFVIVLNGVTHRDGVVFTAEKVLEAVTKPFNLKGHEVFVSSSIGIANFPDDGHDEATLMKNADSAMYHAKQRGKGLYQFYATEMNEMALERLSLINDLHRALERNEFVLHYQPQLDLASGKITGVEALVRWQHPQQGLLPPAKFISLAEENRLILPMGEWILRTASQQAAHWHKMGHQISMSVNISALQVDEHRLLELVDDVRRETGMAPNYLELELTENILIERPDAVYNVFRQLREMGVRLAIDDFGTGYSSLSYLSKLPIDRIKIDRIFVSEIVENADSRSIVEAIISMSHSLRLKTIAEGVETQPQAEMLRTLNCDEMQGFLFSKAVPPEEITVLLAKHQNSD